MSTTVRDLLDAVHDQLAIDPAAPRTPAAALNALTTIAAARPILRGLHLDGVDTQIAGNREHAVVGLLTACTTVARACDGLAYGRPAQLLGAAGDAVSRLRADATSADRWAIALGVGDVVRHATSLYRDHGPDAPNHSIQWARGAATTLARIGAEHPPAPRNLMIQNRPFPAATVSNDAAPLAVAANALATITDAFRRTLRPDTPHATATDLRAVAATAVVAARYVAAITRPPDGPPDLDLVRAWVDVRRAVAALQDGIAPTAAHDLRILHWATRVHDGLVRSLGPADQLTEHAVSALTRSDAKHLAEIASQLPVTAQLLQHSVRRNNPPLYARATDLTPTEQTVEARVRGHVATLGPTDHEHLAVRLTRAAAASERTLTLLNATDATDRTSAQPQIGRRQAQKCRPDHSLWRPPVS